MSAFDFVARAIAHEARILQPASFTELAGKSVPPVIVRIHSSGHAAPGLGAAAYVSDSLCDEALLADHPACVLRTANGRIFRLAADRGAITVEQAGARGDGTSNDQPAFQAAVDYCRAIGCKDVELTQSHYAIWATVRTNHPTTALSHSTDDGKPIVIAADQQLTVRGTGSKQSRLAFRGPGGESFEGTTPGVNFQVVATADGDRVWRGPGFMLRTSETDPGAGERSKLRLENLIVDGGTTKTSDFAWPADPLDGDGWDTSHKGIWVEPDRPFGGTVELYDCEITGWRGECIYAANFSDPAARLVIRNVKAGETNGQPVNPFVTPDIDGFYGYNAFMAYEGWLGEGGRVVNATFVDCYGVFGSSGSAWIQGGTYGLSGDYSTPQRVNAHRVPAGVIDATFRHCSPVIAGSWVQGKLRLIDTGLVLGSTSLNQQGSYECDLDVTLVTDQTGIAGGVVLSGGAGVAGDRRTNRNNLRIRHIRTQYALDNAVNIGVAVQFYGSLGSSNRIHLTGMPANQSPYNTAALLDYAPSFTGDLDYIATSGLLLHNVETAATIALRNPVVQLTTTNTGTFTANMPSGNVALGQEMLLVNITAGATVQFNGNNSATSKVRHPGFVVVPPGGRLRMRYDGNFWSPVSAVAPIRGVHTHGGTAVTMGAHEQNAVARFTNNGTITYTVPADSTLAVPIGNTVEMQHAGSGGLTVAAASGVSLVSRGGLVASAGQHSVMRLQKLAANSWHLSGDLA